jgi:hypothetical protein
MEFVRQMWGNVGFSLPGMVTPTFDTLELSKRIADLKAVEGWLRMNLSMLQMTIQGLEMQNTTLSAVQAMGKMVEQEEVSESPFQEGDGPSVGESLQNAALWPWTIMQKMQEHLQQSADAEAAEAETETPPDAPQKAASAASAARKASAPKKPAAKKPGH